MASAGNMFDRSIRLQIELNQTRTPTQRFQALCELLDFARAMAPLDPASIERRRRALQARQREREEWRAQLRKLVAAQRMGCASADAPLPECENRPPTDDSVR
jgi:hypothetical protein